MSPRWRGQPIQTQVKVLLASAAAFAIALSGPWWHIEIGGVEQATKVALDDWSGTVAIVAFAVVAVATIRHALGWHDIRQVRALAIAGGIAAVCVFVYWQHPPSMRGINGSVGPTWRMYLAFAAGVAAGLSGLSLFNEYR